MLQIMHIKVLLLGFYIFLFGKKMVYGGSLSPLMTALPNVVWREVIPVILVFLVSVM